MRANASTIRNRWYAQCVAICVFSRFSDLTKPAVKARSIPFCEHNTLNGGPSLCISYHLLSQPLRNLHTTSCPRTSQHCGSPLIGQHTPDHNANRIDEHNRVDNRQSLVRAKSRLTGGGYRVSTVNPKPRTRRSQHTQEAHRASLPEQKRQTFSAASERNFSSQLQIFFADSHMKIDCLAKSSALMALEICLGARCCLCAWGGATLKTRVVTWAACCRVAPVLTKFRRREALTTIEEASR